MMNAGEFWTRVAVYNERMWPIVIAMCVVAAFLAFRVFLKPGGRTDVWMKAFLGFAFAWNGVVFFLISVRNPISTFTGAPLFVVVALLFAVDIWTKKISFQLPWSAWKKRLTLFWISLAFLYPVIGLPFGHTYPEMLLPMFPCPLTVFAIALVAAAAPHVDRKVFVLLLPWALMALPKCFGALDCYEDSILFAAGVYGLVELIRNWNPERAGAREERLVQHTVSG